MSPEAWLALGSGEVCNSNPTTRTLSASSGSGFLGSEGSAAGIHVRYEFIFVGQGQVPTLGQQILIPRQVEAAAWVPLLVALQFPGPCQNFAVQH